MTYYAIKKTKAAGVFAEPITDYSNIEQIADYLKNYRSQTIADLLAVVQARNDSELEILVRTFKECEKKTIR